MILYLLLIDYTHSLNLAMNLDILASKFKYFKVSQVSCCII